MSNLWPIRQLRSLLQSERSTFCWPRFLCIFVFAVWTFIYFGMNMFSCRHSPPILFCCHSYCFLHLLLTKTDITRSHMYNYVIKCIHNILETICSLAEILWPRTENRTKQNKTPITIIFAAHVYAKSSHKQTDTHNTRNRTTATAALARATGTLAVDGRRARMEHLPTVISHHFSGRI